MIRVLFTLSKKLVSDDYRPVIWPIKYPYWCTGESDTDFTMVAYVDSIVILKKQWPEAANIEFEEVSGITFSSRFPKPDWYTEPDKKVKKDRTPLNKDLIDMILAVMKTLHIVIENGELKFKHQKDEDNYPAIKKAIETLPETNKFKDNSPQLIMYRLREPDSIMYIAFLNYLKQLQTRTDASTSK